MVKKLFEAYEPTRAEEKDSAIAADPINVPNIAAAPAAPTIRGITIREPESARPHLKVIPKRKGKEPKESESFDAPTSLALKKAKK